ncbi:hypothetical protein GPA10_00020 [Streptomyces sp. p1417]|uniref:Uncharacterized protein n=1 Tax=Streptomyces typhae TaxID=2681492 RepID=A0A6L6WPW1_9ACTN|nr:hypothetical protein [Streptomyces typhae]MVO83184.1 hypothetical protein [Streptomyces typhae]
MSSGPSSPSDPSNPSDPSYRSNPFDSSRLFSRSGLSGASAPAGALLLCRAGADSVETVAQLLRQRMLLLPAGDEWSVLVPEGTPWLDGGEPVDRVLTGWATALAVGSPWPVLALWWDADRSGCTLASGFRRTVGYVWLANGTAAGEDEAMRTLATRLGLDPVLDMQALDTLTRPDPHADARARMRGLLAVLTRVGVALPPGLGPGEPADRLRKAARTRADVRHVEWSGWREAVRAEFDAAEHGPLGRALAGAQLATGVPLLLWSLGRRSHGWTAAGALLVMYGVLGLAQECERGRGAA